MPKLKDHLLPRIQAMILKEAMSLPGHESLVLPNVGLSFTTSNKEQDSVLFKNDNMYKHQLLRVNYTTYNVRRSQDVINPNTSHRDIMLLANSDSQETNLKHKFLYAHVLGIYHVNVIYVGPGMLDYCPRRLDFLWVR